MLTVIESKLKTRQDGSVHYVNKLSCKEVVELPLGLGTKTLNRSYWLGTDNELTEGMEVGTIEQVKEHFNIIESVYEVAKTDEEGDEMMNEDGVVIMETYTSKWLEAK